MKKMEDLATWRGRGPAGRGAPSSPVVSAPSLMGCVLFGLYKNLSVLTLSVPHDQQFHFWVYTHRTYAVAEIYTCAWMLRAALFTVAKRSKQPECPLAGTERNKIWPILTIKHYSVLQRNDVWSHAKAWMSLEGNSRWNEANKGLILARKDKYCRFHLYEVPRVVRFRDRKWNSGCQGLGGRVYKKLLFNGDRVLVWKDEKHFEDGWWGWLPLCECT